MHKLPAAVIVAFLLPAVPALAQTKQTTDCEAGDQRACAALADMSSASMDVRLAAVRRLTDQELLAGVARTSQNGDIRHEAIHFLIDQDALTDIARHARAAIDRGRAAERLKNQQVLAAIARNDTSKWVRQRAAYTLTDEAEIRKLAESNRELLPTLVTGNGIRHLTVDGKEVRESLLGVTSILPGQHTITADYAVKDNVIWENGNSRSAKIETRLGATYVVEADLGIVTWEYLAPRTRCGRGTWTLAVREALSSGPNLLPQLLR